MTGAYPWLFSPFELKQQRLRNRLVVAPMSRVSTCGDGIPTERMIDYYGDFGAGGFGLTITEGVYTDQVASQGYPDQPGLTSAAQADGWATVVDRLHQSGSKVVAQLMHAGALSQVDRVRPVAPSAVLPEGRPLREYGGAADFRVPLPASPADLTTIVEGFRSATRLARYAGFDGIEIHAANGYLLDQFLTTYTNERSDRYGGDMEGRVRFPAEVVAAVRSEVDAGFVIGVRISEAKVNDSSYRWPGGNEDATRIALALSAAGADYIHLAGEGLGWKESVVEDASTTSGIIRKRVGIPVIVNGGLEEAHRADGVIASGHADLIALGRAALATPEWPSRVLQGLPVEPFVPEMIQPYATIENTDLWRATRSSHRPTKTRTAGVSAKECT